MPWQGTTARRDAAAGVGRRDVAEEAVACRILHEQPRILLIMSYTTVLRSGCIWPKQRRKDRALAFDSSLGHAPAQ